MENRDQKKRKKNHVTITAANDDNVEVELPVEIIQRIQSKIQYSCKFLGEEKAARTSLVSKSWYRAWTTRPDLVFNRHYQFPTRAAVYWEFVKTTMKRNEDLNLNIRSLRLVMTDEVSLAIAKELIVRAIKLGVVDLTIQNMNRNKVFVLPHEVLQSQTLARLYLMGGSSYFSGFFTINLSRLRREKKEEVTCYNLKSLELENTTVKDDLLRDFISRCPLIEELRLDSVYDTGRKLDDEFDKPLEFPKVKYMSLEILYKLHWHDLWARFACLKEFELVNYRDEDLRIRIPSLERISIVICETIKNVEFDFPNIQKFNWEGPLPRRFELKTCTNRRYEWESTIDIMYCVYGPSGTEWFIMLNQFVRMLSLSRSRVSLSIKTDVGNWDEFSYHPRYFGDGLAIHAVEKLRLTGFQLTPAFLDALFWNCSPKFVEIQHKCLFGMKKVNVERFQQLRSLPWETIYCASSNEDGYDVRFQLN